MVEMTKGQAKAHIYLQKLRKEKCKNCKSVYKQCENREEIMVQNGEKYNITCLTRSELNKLEEILKEI